MLDSGVSYLTSIKQDKATTEGAVWWASAISLQNMKQVQ